jgi:hypothetical protein
VEIVLNIANKSIPETSTNSAKIIRPWFADGCHHAVASRGGAEGLFGGSPTSLGLSGFRMYRAGAGRTIDFGGRKSWETCVSGLGSHTPMDGVWNAVGRVGVGVLVGNVNI